MTAVLLTQSMQQLNFTFRTEWEEKEENCKNVGSTVCSREYVESFVARELSNFGKCFTSSI
jgi:hypothetical protein